MANVLGTPITIDTTGVVTTDNLIVQSVYIVPSGDNPVVILHDKNGKEILRNTTAIANHRTPGPGVIGPTIWRGITANTLTNITRVFVYLSTKAQ